MAKPALNRSRAAYEPPCDSGAKMKTFEVAAWKRPSKIASGGSSRMAFVMPFALIEYDRLCASRDVAR